MKALIASVFAVFASSLSDGARANVFMESADCSGAIFKMDGMTADRRALILTSGHCVKAGRYKGRFPEDGEFLVDVPSKGRVRLLTRDGRWRSARYDRIVFATMTGVDLAVIALDRTYAEIVDDNVEIYALSRDPVSLKQRVDVVSPAMEKTFRCEIEKIVPILKEGPWTWTNVARLTHSKKRCQFFSGVSGAQAIDKETNQIVALAHTMYEKGEACAFSNPCEVDDSGQVSVAENYGQSYLTQTWQLHSCYDSSANDFRFDSPECRLRKGR